MYVKVLLNMYLYLRCCALMKFLYKPFEIMVVCKQTLQRVGLSPHDCKLDERRFTLGCLGWST